ncbi:3-deoxy-7-phosphoheptulonate synthase [Sphingomicrobium sediminis]|uniref:Phospho-2-dehydro-3-deoxyheptonate aldolase n=1 Tax=Sphingomicrobium sediminis TaxID=2950949 RepID=A0A9X2J3I9_9SPHN|nr:3-deoxy-7-phosphoheptulonate synthase [Sphingomicrobium sediminis]MCM8556257.1 3-deoxy-7-phosphoheptulonate synthase [Sphingomicrobium sediminis]
MIHSLRQLRANGTDPAIVHLREKIDAIDTELLSLLERRFALTDMIGQEKQIEGKLALCPDRETALLDRLSERRIGLDSNEIEALWRTIFALSTHRQKAHDLILWAEEPQRVALTELARRRFGPRATIVWAHSAAHAIGLAAEQEAVLLMPLYTDLELPAGLDLVAQLDLDDADVAAAVALAPLAPSPDQQQADWRKRARRQQATYGMADQPRLKANLKALAKADDVVAPRDSATLRRSLADLRQNGGLIIQMGDCAEPIDLDEKAIEARLGAIDLMRERLAATTGQRVVALARLGGQWAKPRSCPVEYVDGEALPVYRGDLVNGIGSNKTARRPDPDRLVAGHQQALRVSQQSAQYPEVHLSHEALHLDYECALTRDTSEGRMATSAHSLWLGARTGNPDEAHAAYLAGIGNAIGIKVGADMEPERLVRLLDMLDPDHEAGRIMLVCRMGARNVMKTLPRIADAVCRSGHPVLWLCDPMHGNTRKSGGLKTRAMSDMLAEIQDCAEILRATSMRLDGLHLETTPEQVDECVETPSGRPGLVGYTSLCDPRLNLDQTRRCIDLMASLAE